MQATNVLHLVNNCFINTPLCISVKTVGQVRRTIRFRIKLTPTIADNIHLFIRSYSADHIFALNRHQHIQTLDTKLGVTYLQSSGWACLVNIPGCDFLGHWNSPPSSSMTMALLHSGTWSGMQRSSMSSSSPRSHLVSPPTSSALLVIGQSRWTLISEK